MTCSRATGTGAHPRPAPHGCTPASPRAIGRCRGADSRRATRCSPRRGTRAHTSRPAAASRRRANKGGGGRAGPGPASEPSRARPGPAPPRSRQSRAREGSGGGICAFKGTSWPESTGCRGPGGWRGVEGEGGEADHLGASALGVADPGPQRDLLFINKETDAKRGNYPGSHSELVAKRG